MLPFCLFPAGKSESQTSKSDSSFDPSPLSAGCLWLHVNSIFLDQPRLFLFRRRNDRHFGGSGSQLEGAGTATQEAHRLSRRESQALHEVDTKRPGMQPYSDPLQWTRTSLSSIKVTQRVRFLRHMSKLQSMGAK